MAFYLVSAVPKQSLMEELGERLCVGGAEGPSRRMRPVRPETSCVTRQLVLARSRNTYGIMPELLTKERVLEALRRVRSLAPGGGERGEGPAGGRGRGRDADRRPRARRRARRRQRQGPRGAARLALHAAPRPTRGPPP